MPSYKNPRSVPHRPRQFRASAQRPLAMLSQCPVYKPTPMPTVAALAAALDVHAIYVKDESQRMNLGSFKALGGAYAVAQMLLDKAATTDITSTAAIAVAKNTTFITASAGNHGLSVAAGARLFNANAVIVLSTAVPETFAARIRASGAQVVRVTGDYADSVEHAIKCAAEKDYLLLADGSWAGYTARPALVMEGYTVLAEEARLSFAKSGVWPTHVFLQAGVGGLAAAVAAHVREYWAQQPTIIVVEPDAAPCLLASMRAGKLTRAAGAESNMGRLDCKDASLIAFTALRDDADLFVTVTDAQAAAAATLIAAHGFPSTPSGAAAFAALQQLPIPATSRCLMIVSEGME